MIDQNHEQTADRIKNDKEFRVLYHQHRRLDNKIREADLGVLPIDDVTLTNMKKEKLQAKERLLRMRDDQVAESA